MNFDSFLQQHINGALQYLFISHNNRENKLCLQVGTSHELLLDKMLSIVDIR